MFFFILPISLNFEFNYLWKHEVLVQERMVNSLLTWTYEPVCTPHVPLPRERQSTSDDSSTYK